MSSLRADDHARAASACAEDVLRVLRIRPGILQVRVGECSSLPLQAPLAPGEDGDDRVEQVLPDGDLLGRATGHDVVAGATVGAVIYTTGPVSYRVDGTSGAVTITSPAPRTVNLCDELG